VAQITQEVCLVRLPQVQAKHLSHPNLSLNTLTVCNHPTLTDPWGVGWVGKCQLTLHNIMHPVIGEPNKFSVFTSVGYLTSETIAPDD